MRPHILEGMAIVRETSQEESAGMAVPYPKSQDSQPGAAAFVTALLQALLGSKEEKGAEPFGRVYPEWNRRAQDKPPALPPQVQGAPSKPVQANRAPGSSPEGTFGFQVRQYAPGRIDSGSGEPLELSQTEPPPVDEEAPPQIEPHIPQGPEFPLPPPMQVRFGAEGPIEPPETPPTQETVIIEEAVMPAVEPFEPAAALAPEAEPLPTVEADVEEPQVTMPRPVLQSGASQAAAKTDTPVDPPQKQEIVLTPPNPPQPVEQGSPENPQVVIDETSLPTSPTPEAVKRTGSEVNSAPTHSVKQNGAEETPPPQIQRPPLAQPQTSGQPANAPVKPQPQPETAKAENKHSHTAPETNAHDSKPPAQPTEPTRVLPTEKPEAENAIIKPLLKPSKTEASQQKVEAPRPAAEASVQTKPPTNFKADEVNHSERAIVTEPVKTEGKVDKSSQPLPAKGLEIDGRPLQTPEVRVADFQVDARQGAEAVRHETASVQGREVIEQITNITRMEIGRGQKQIFIQLDPPHLGKVYVRVSSEGGIVSANLEVTAPVVRDLLEANLEQLRTALGKADVGAGECTVSLGTGWEGETANARDFQMARSPRRIRSPKPVLQPTSAYPQSMRRHIWAEGATLDYLA